MIRYQLFRYIFAVSALVCSYHVLQAMNMVRPYKFWYDPAPHYGTRWQLFVRPEHGLRARGYDCCNNRVNVLQIWNAEQDALAMLDGFDISSEIGQKREQLDVSSNGVRGRFKACADLDVDFGCTFALRRALPHNIMLGLYLPFYTIRLHNVRWIDRTLNINEDDERVHQYLTDDFARNICELGQLSLGSWRRTGLGDLALVGNWIEDFIQPRPYLKNVRINARAGATFPTGLKYDPDKLIAFPFGYNNTACFLFGGGLNLTFFTCLHAGFDVELRKPIGNSFVSRIRTDQCQTDLLLLQKACVYHDYAFQQQYTLFGEYFNTWTGLSFKLMYQFFKIGDDLLSVFGNTFSSRTANCSEFHQERVLHSIITMLNFDAGAVMNSYCRAIPTVSLYGEWPFRGKRFIACPIIGAVIGVDF